MAQYDITSKVLFQDYERDFIALALGIETLLQIVETEFGKRGVEGLYQF